MRSFLSCFALARPERDESRESSCRSQSHRKSSSVRGSKDIDDALHTIRKVSFANMSNDDSLFHSMRHIEQVTTFMESALKCFSITSIDDGALGTRDDFDVIMMCSAYMHDVCHPASSISDKRVDIERIAGDCMHSGSSLVYRKSLDIESHINQVIVDIKSSKIESLHAVIGTHFAASTIAFSEYQKQFMMSMILATDLASYSDIRTMNLVTPTLRDIGKVMMRCSDLSHFTLPWKGHLEWVRRLSKEINSKIKPEGQVSFIDNCVTPQFQMLHCFCRCQCTFDWLSCIQSNRGVWEGMASGDNNARKSAVAASKLRGFLMGERLVAPQ